jgi:hypothetical protein
MTLLLMSFAALNRSYTTLNSGGIRAQAPHALLRYPGASSGFQPNTVRDFGGRGSPVWVQNQKHAISHWEFRSAPITAIQENEIRSACPIFISAI